MLRKTYDTLAKQLQMNMDCQDFYKDPYTDLWIDSKSVMDIYPTMEFRHPLYVLNGNQENVFPERAQLDVDKEFEPAIALVMAFSMKENRLELERFRSMPIFPEFKEIKDFGIRFYALDCGADIQKAASVSIDIIKNVFEGEKVQTIQVTSFDATGEQICTKFIQPQKPKMHNAVNSTKPQNNTHFISASNQMIVCPHCGSRLTVSKELEKTYYLKCNICGGEFANPLNPIGKSENWLSKNGCLIFIIFIIVISAIAYITDGGERIKADGTTVYTITEDIYAPSTEAAAKAMINSMVRNGNDPISNLEHVYHNDADFTHVFANDKVVVIRRISSGYLIRKLRDYQTAVVPNDSYLKE